MCGVCLCTSYYTAMAIQKRVFMMPLVEKQMGPKDTQA